MPCRSACPRSALLQQLPLRPLNRLSPKRLLSRFSSLEPYLCLTHSFSALPPEHRLDGAFPNRWTRAKRRGDRPAVGCAVPFYRSDRPRSPGPPPPNGIVFRFYPAPPLSGAAPFRRSSAVCTARRMPPRGRFRRLFAPPQNATKIPCGRMVSCTERRTQKKTARTRFSECAPSFGEKEEKRDENKSVRFPLSG